MEAKIFTKLIREYDDYLNSLRHVCSLRINNNYFKKMGINVGYKSVEAYLSPKINEAHQQTIDHFINGMLGNEIGFNDVREVREFIYYPDFYVKSHIDNPANLFKNCTSIEQTVLIAPVYELNLKIDDASKTIPRTAQILRIKRLELGPTTNVFSVIEEKIDNYMLEGGMRNMILRFRERFGSEPTKNDLILLRNITIKYLIEKVLVNRENGIECLYEEDAYLSYDYLASKFNICNRYNVSFKDKYTSLSTFDSPWIFRGLEYFDNRLMVTKNGNNNILPLTYQRTKNSRF